MVKVTVWLTGGMLVDHAIRRRPSSLRHVVAVLAALGVPVIFFFNLSPRPEANGWQPLAPVWERVEVAREPATETAFQGTGGERMRSAQGVTSGGVIAPYLPDVVVAIWGAGVLVGWLRIIGRAWPGRRPGLLIDPGLEAVLVEAVDRECARTGIADRPRMHLVPDGPPRLNGLWRPTVELPETAVDWPESKLTSVVRHELAHLRRGDIWWLLVTEAALALGWGHPLAMRLRRQLARLREEACDDLVLTSGVDPAGYAADLASFLTVSDPASPRWGLLAVARRGWLMRFHRLLDPTAARRSVRWWEVAGLSVVAGAVVVGGTMSVGCAGPQPQLAVKPSFLETYPEPLPTVRSTARKLNIKLKVFQLAVREQDAPALGFPEGFPRVGGKVLSPEEGWQLFHIRRKGTDLLTAPTVVAKPGQKAKVEVARDFIYPLEVRTNQQTGAMEIVSYEKTKVGVLLAVAARPTPDPAVIQVQYEFEMKEFDGFIKDPQTTMDQLIFHTRRIADDVEMRNGSYLIVGFKPATQTVEDAVPVLSEIPLLGRLFRVVREEAYGELAAVQVIVEEP